MKGTPAQQRVTEILLSSLSDSFGAPVVDDYYAEDEAVGTVMVLEMPGERVVVSVRSVSLDSERKRIEQLSSVTTV